VNNPNGCFGCKDSATEEQNSLILNLVYALKNKCR
jgi:hypothetical protein